MTEGSVRFSRFAGPGKRRAECRKKEIVKLRFFGIIGRVFRANLGRAMADCGKDSAGGLAAGPLRGALQETGACRQADGSAGSMFEKGIFANGRR